jgi:hypothetical protein
LAYCEQMNDRFTVLGIDSSTGNDIPLLMIGERSETDCFRRKCGAHEKGVRIRDFRLGVCIGEEKVGSKHRSNGADKQSDDDYNNVVR